METKQYLRIIGLTALAIVVFSGISFVLRPMDKMVERKVMVNSHQYIEGMEQRARVLQAGIDEIDALLMTNPENRKDLEAQRRALSAQLKATIK